MSKFSKRWLPRIPRDRLWSWFALAPIIVLAAILRFANLESLGYANHYYTAAVASMLKSWHNFFFVAAEPGGAVSVDKPPVGLWLQALSAHFLGVTGFAVLLPQLLAGVLSVIVLYHLVRRSFGAVAGLLAALILAITPITIATDRNNTMDSTLILALLLAAWAFVKAAETNKLYYLLLGAVLVGIGFNIKMLQSYLPLPAFYGLYFLGSLGSLWRKIGRLALASILLLAISLSWSVAVDLTPPDRRPYIGSSGDNSVMSLILGYNGINRLLGMFGRRPGGPPRAFLPGRPPANGQPPPGGRFMPPGSDGNNNPLMGRPRIGIFPDGGPAAGFSSIGQPGALRLFIPPLSKEMSWLLPFGLISALLLAASSRFCWPLSPNHQSLALWGGWLLVGGIFFSIAGFFHEYYLSMLAPPLAALSAIGVILLWRLGQTHQNLMMIVLLAATAGTLAFQAMTARAFTSNLWWLFLAFVLFVAGSILLGWSARIKNPCVFRAGFICAIASILITPGVWSGYTNAYPSENQSLPSAYAGQLSGPVNRGGLQINQDLLAYLNLRTTDVKYLMAVPSSMQGADYVLATGRPVLYIGGFNGQDQVVTPQDLNRMVQENELRFILWNVQGGGFGSRADISSWISSACTPVPGFETMTRNLGAPDGTIGSLDYPIGPQGGRFLAGPGGFQVTLYQCERKR